MNTGNGSDERRMYLRQPAEIDVQGSPTETGGVMARMVSRNLSLGGLYCTSTRDFPEMTRLAVRLMLPDGPAGIVPLDVEAVVVRREEAAAINGDLRYDLALFFTNLDEPARARLRTFLAR